MNFKLKMKKDELEKKLKALFVEIVGPQPLGTIGGPQSQGVFIGVFPLGEENQCVAYTSQEYMVQQYMPDITGNYFEFDISNKLPPIGRNNACIYITTNTSAKVSRNLDGFWSGTPYASESGLVATLQTDDTFRSTPELQNGFAYNVKLSDIKQFTIRGHERNLEVQYRTIKEYVDLAKKLCKQSHNYVTNFKKQLQENHEKLTDEVESMKKKIKSITEQGKQDCLNQIDQVQTSAESVTLAMENSSDTHKLIDCLNNDVKQLLQKLNYLGRPSDIKLAINRLEGHIQNFKSEVLFKDEYVEANGLVNALKEVTHRFQITIAERPLNSVKGNIVRIYTEEHLTLNEKMAYYCCAQLLWSFPRFDVKTDQLKAEFVEIAILKFEEMLELMPKMKRTLESILKNLNTIHEHLLCHEKFPSFDIDKYCGDYTVRCHHLKNGAIKLLNDGLIDSKKCASKKWCSKHLSFLQVAIIYVTILEQFYMISDKTLVRMDVIHFLDDYFKNTDQMFIHDKQLYLVTTSSIISLCQTNQTESEEFKRLLRFAAQHWNVRRLFGVTEKGEEHRTCLTSLANFCKTTKSNILKITVRMDKNEKPKEQLEKLASKLDTLGTKIENVENCFQDMVLEFKSVQNTAAEDNHLAAVIKNVERQYINAKENLAQGNGEKIKDFVDVLEEGKRRIADCKKLAEAIAKPVDGSQTAEESENLIIKLVTLLDSFRSTQHYEKKHEKDITDFITRFGKRDVFTGGTNKILRDTVSEIKGMKTRLKRGKGMGSYEAAIAKDGLIKLEEAEAALNPNYLHSVLDRLKGIIQTLKLRDESEASASDLVELMKIFQREHSFKSPEELAESRQEENPEQLVKDILKIIDGKSYEAKAVDQIDSLTSIISKLLKHVDPEDYQAQLRSSWAEYMMPTFTRTYEQLRQVVIKRDMAKLREASTHFSLHLVRREWLNSSMEYIPYYCWNGDPIKEDPYYTENDTHIPCEKPMVL